MQPTVPACFTSTSIIFSLLSSLLSKVQHFIHRRALMGKLTISCESVDGLLYPRPLDFPTFKFRLLTLLPAGEDEADDRIIRCSLRYHFLIERYDDTTGNTFPVPDYVALSYCWGDPSITRAILVNDLFVQITTNLEAALRALRALKIETLWVDALCINQLELLERGLQVMRMGLIYSNSSSVIAWIGEAADGSNLAMDYLYDRAQMLLGTKPPRELDHYESDSGPEKFFTVEDSVSALFRRSYWKRVWIIQEISKGREVYVLCGLRTIKWGFLHVAIQGWKLPNKEVNALNYFRGGERNKQRPTIEQALSRSKMFLATDVRDKIYRLLGLTSDGSDIVPAPNYLQPATSVYFQLFKGLLSERRDLAYLFESRVSSTDHNIKTSISLFEPDWTNLESGIPHWLLMVLGKRLSKRGITKSNGIPVLHEYFSTFSSSTLHNPDFPWRIFPWSRTYFTSEDRTALPVLLKDGLRTEIYVLDSIESIGTIFHSSDSARQAPEPPPDTVPEASEPATSSNVPSHATWVRDQNNQAAEPSHVCKSLCQALFSASFLAPSVIMNADDSIKTRNFSDLILADIIIDVYEARTEPLMPYHHLSEWLSENQDLYIHGRTLKHWIELRMGTHRPWYDLFKNKAVRGRLASKWEPGGRKVHTTKSWPRRGDEIKGLG